MHATIRPLRTCTNLGWMMGFEPTTPGITIRCSNQLSYTHQSCLALASRLARPAGIEPATAGLEGRCSIRLSYGRPDRIVASKPGLRGCRGLVGVEGFEPPTSCSQSRRATRLRYTPPAEPTASLRLQAPATHQRYERPRIVRPRGRAVNAALAKGDSWARFGQTIAFRAGAVRASPIQLRSRVRAEPAQESSHHASLGRIHR